MFAIFGSGFGLYGYLPALVGNGETVVLPRRYEKQLHARPELIDFKSAIRWVDTDGDALEAATGVVIAQRPEDQPEKTAVSIPHPRLTSFILEKPLAPTPAVSIALLDTLRRAKKSCRIGYSFLYTDWMQVLRGPNSDRGELSINWEFMAHHYRQNLHNWKRFHKNGGGALRFYGIQLIAVLAELGYDHVEASRTSGAAIDDIERWKAIFSGKDRLACQVNINSKSPRSLFSISLQTGKAETTQLLYKSDDPFEAKIGQSGQDRRVPMLSQIHRSLRENDSNWYARYENINRLWALTETITRFEPSERV